MVRSSFISVITFLLVLLFQQQQQQAVVVVAAKKSSSNKNWGGSVSRSLVQQRRRKATTSIRSIESLPQDILPNRYVFWKRGEILYEGKFFFLFKKRKTKRKKIRLKESIHMDKKWDNLIITIDFLE